MNDISQKYEIIRDIDEGAFGAVLLARSKATGNEVAIKKMKKKVRSWAECTELREVKVLDKVKHPNVVKLLEVLKINDELFLIFEYVHTNLYKLYLSFRQRSEQIPESLVKSLAHQTLSGLAAIHKKGYFHRDMKPENILVNDRNMVKIADFGLAKEIRSAPPFTDYVSTRWYRAPELLLKAEVYNAKVDIFALGCIIVEMYLLAPLFAGENEMDQLHKIISVLGTPPQEWTFGHKQAKRLNIRFKECERISLHVIIPNANSHAINLLERMLQYDPVKRISAADALAHPYFSESIKTAYNGANSPTLRPSAQLKGNQSEIFERAPFKASSRLVNDVTNLGAFDADDSFGIDNSALIKGPAAKEVVSHRSNILDELDYGSRSLPKQTAVSPIPKKPLPKAVDDLENDIDFFFSNPSPKPSKNYTSTQMKNELSAYLPQRKVESPSFMKLENPRFEASLHENYSKSKKDRGTFEDFDGILEKEFKYSKEKSVPVNAYHSLPKKFEPSYQPKTKMISFEDDDDWDDVDTTKAPQNRGFLF